MSELWVGSTTALPMPEPERTSASITTVVAMPVKRENSPHAVAPMIAMRTRLLRSAYQAIGTWSASAPRLTTAMSVRAPCRPRWNASRISGSRMPKAVRSSSSTALSPNSTTMA